MSKIPPIYESLNIIRDHFLSLMGDRDKEIDRLEFILDYIIKEANKFYPCKVTGIQNGNLWYGEAQLKLGEYVTLEELRRTRQ